MINNFGKNLKECRQKFGLTQNEIARKAGISGSAISQIEKGDRNPSLTTAYDIVNALGISIYDLFDDNTYSDKDVFYAEFKALRGLSTTDQELIAKLIDRLTKPQNRV